MQSRRGVRGGSKLNEKSMQRGCVPVYGCKSSKSDAGRERERSGGPCWCLRTLAEAGTRRIGGQKRRREGAEGWTGFRAIKIPRLCKFRSVEIPRKINRANVASVAEASPFVSLPFSFVRFRVPLCAPFLAPFCAAVTHLQVARVD